MGDQTSGAILDAIFGIGKIAAAFVAQCIKGTVTKQAAEVCVVCALVAGKIFTISVLEEIIICHSLTPLI